MNLWIALGCLALGLLMVFWALFHVRRNPSSSDQLTVLSRFFLIALRLAIGWHFLIEGIHKFEVPNWSSEVYLRESVGPAAPLFRKLAGDPVVEKLTPTDASISPALEREWKRYFDAYAAYYKLDAEQLKMAQINFDQLKADTFDWLNSAKLPTTMPSLYPPDDVRLDRTIVQRLADLKKYEAVLRDVESQMANADPQVLVARVETLKKLEMEKIKEMEKEIHSAKNEDDKDKAIYERNLAIAKSKANIDNMTAVQKSLKKEADALYLAAKKNVADFRAELKRDLDARTEFFKKNLLPAPPEEKKETKPEAKASKEEKKAEEKKKVEPKTVLRKDQAALPPLTEPVRLPLSEWSLLDWSNAGVKYGLVAVGGLLILGFFSRLAALVGAFYLLMFFVAMPPLPWYPENPRAEGHYLFINKNIVEMLALLVLATLPTGRWAGIDALVALIFPGRQNRAGSATM
jgi:uncharacterized membrane protein YphA (DoxX/SURF4 family)